MHTVCLKFLKFIFEGFFSVLFFQGEHVSTHVKVGGTYEAGSLLPPSRGLQVPKSSH